MLSPVHVWAALILSVAGDSLTRFVLDDDATLDIQLSDAGIDLLDLLINY